MSKNTIVDGEFVVEPSPSGAGYYAYLPRRTAIRGVGGTPEIAVAQLERMLDPANSASAIMDRMQVLSTAACQPLVESGESNFQGKKDLPREQTKPKLAGLRALVGGVGYAIREAVNEVRCGALWVADVINTWCFKVIDRLDADPDIAHYRRQARGR